MKPGFAFSEHVRSEHLPKRHHNGTSPQSLRFYLLLFVIGLSGIIMIFRLFSLQMMQGSYYRSLSDSNRIRTTVIHAPRGIIFDRNGTPLVYNTPGFRTIGKDHKIKIIPRDEALARIAKGEKDIYIDSLRSYPHKESLSHVLGYVGQITQDEVESGQFSDYTLDNVIGKTGVELQYEKLLAGTDGKELTEVDAMGKKLRVLGQTDPIPGHDITLTIDAKLQDSVYQAMHDVQKGAAIVSTPKGEILAMVSKPSFDPNLFTQDPSYKTATDAAYTNVESILTDGQNQPLLNRAIGGVYPPGSTFKIVMAASGLENHIIDDHYIVKDTGIIHVGSFSFSNWYYTQNGKTDGDVDIVKAIQRSNDIFFYKLAEKIGIDTISATGKQYGLGQTIGIDLPGEEAGVLPTKEWKQKEIGEQWYLGDTYIYGIGQGYLLTTPLQVNTWTQIIANGGELYKPHVLKTQDPKPVKTNLLNAKSDTLIRDGMTKACETGGTAFPLYNFKVKNPSLPIDNKNFFAVTTNATASAGLKDAKDWRLVSVACKTGTAQHGDEKTEPHAWITLFAPAKDPQVVVTVLSESSGEGSTVSGPIAKDILESWFTEK